MEKANVVSIWVGKFNAENELNKFIDEIFDDNGDSSSNFIEKFELDYINYDKMESLFFQNCINKNDLLQVSYGETFVNKIDDNLLNGDGIIMLYDFEYEGKIRTTNNISFVGVYEYEK